MDRRSDFLRYASPMELRFVAREEMNIYHAVIVGAVYIFPTTFDTLDASSYFNALEACILRHAYLSVVIEDTHTDKAYYRRVRTVDLRQHISILQELRDQDERSSLEDIFRSYLDKPFTSGQPPWRVVVLPLSKGRVGIAFCYSHTVGDGATGAAFHHTFLQTLNASSAGDKAEVTSSKIVDIPERQISLPFDTAERLPISWSYLLVPLLGVFLPGWLGKLLGVRASPSAVDKGAWTGSKVHIDQSKGSQSQVVLREISAHVLSNALKLARKNDAKLTAVLQELIARALARTVPDAGRATNLICQTAINMRPACGMPSDEMGNAVSGNYSNYLQSSITSPTFDAESWTSAREKTKALELAAASLQDQPTGLLRYLPSVRKWMLSKDGQQRDCSFEMSNIGAHDFSHAIADGKAEITKMFFGQPGHATSAPLAFLFVSVKGGSLVYTATWPKGSLALPDGQSEEQLVKAICEAIEEEMTSL